MKKIAALYGLTVLAAYVGIQTGRAVAEIEADMGDEHPVTLVPAVAACWPWITAAALVEGVKGFGEDMFR